MRKRLSLIISGFLFLGLPPTIGNSAESGARAYNNAPTGLNVLQFVYSHSETKGKSDIRTNAGALYYYRYFGLFNKIALIGGFIPYADVHVSVPKAGLQLHSAGMGDPTIIIGMDFLGAPALDRKGFAHYHQDLIIGGSLQIAAPLGRYKSGNSINIGNNRWSFRPELAISKTIGGLVFDLFGNYQFFTDNRDYRSGLIKSQLGKWGIESHLSYILMRGMWASADYFHFWGGETIISGINQHNAARDSTIGLTINKSLASGYSIQGKYRHDTVSQSGNKARRFTIKLQKVW